MIGQVSGDKRYPEIHVQLSGEDGNSYVIVGRVRRSMRLAGVPDSEIEEFTADAMSANHDHVIQTTMRWVTAS